MLSFFKNLSIERLSFWIGFVAASLFWWLFRILAPRLSGVWSWFQKRFQSAQKGLRSNILERHRLDTLKHAQGLHLAAPLFALDEILVPPRLLAPPVILPPGESPPTDNIIQKAIPYMPNCPQLASLYGAHTLSLEESLRGGLNIAVVGPAGSGKTVALADLASRLIKGSLQQDDGDLENRVPILIHASNLNLPLEEGEALLHPVTEAVAIYSSTLSQPGLPKFIQRLFASAQALLLLDGLDELSPDGLKETIAYLEDLLEQCPQTRLVVAADADHLDGLSNLDFEIMPVAWWGRRQQTRFARQWAGMWMDSIDEEMERQEEQYVYIDPLIINGWLLSQSGLLSPLEFSLQLWAAYAGDRRGPKGSDALEAYVQRMTTETKKGIEALERFAAQAIVNMQTSFTVKQARQWAGEILPEMSAAEALDEQDGSRHEDITIPRVIPDLIQSGLLVRRTRDRIGFVHPLMMAYLASNALGDEVFSQPAWPLQKTARHYIAHRRNISPHINEQIDQKNEPLYLGPFKVSSWLSDVPQEAPWREHILSQVIHFLQDDSLPLATRARIMTGVALTKSADIAALFRHLMKSAKPSVRQLAALGSGLQSDTQAVDQLTTLLNDDPLVGGSACLALVNIGTQPALEAVAMALLEGGEALRRAAAEALANHPEEGHPTLRDGSAVDDLLVRRAVIFGLRRVGEPWAIEVLEQTQIEDAQWVVKNAAAQAFEELMQPDPHIPAPLPSLSETSWLIAFAGERGVGISPGKPAQEMLVRALTEGNSEERLAALLQIRRRGIMDIFPGIYDLVYGQEENLRNEAITTLWHFYAIDTEIPPPMQFGLG